MPKRNQLPPTASIAQDAGEGRLFAPSAERNADAIANALSRHVPPTGRALEIASGTGQHAVRLATTLPGLDWHPSEIDPDRRISIDAYAQAASLPNLHPALTLDATTPGWGTTVGQYNLIVLANLLHLISEPETLVLLTEARAALFPGGILALYGPFLRDGNTTSEADTRFHASLRASDPEIGYKDAGDIRTWLSTLGFELKAVEDMPANNLLFFARVPVE
ncbi:class I SAM-dependent methyltransferase [Roseovarius pelagicus]|uniref:Class I SAM-dependent methyltransferase n=1 Tax=Roseovarius pelagicus TaxID=2980108 RepID=A0ABY6DDY3_9RHOB|nr:class I SAM-dependent methyltransferase [Roseovarius pelagicus]UXX83188.1 class I SAM-dependent methyltransferase [Roseovarius pelagicus]